MGFFSWITQDTRKSISNVHTDRGPLRVTMTDNKGNRWHEDEYDGYGVFGGKDYFELLAEMNGLGPDRDKGINLVYDSGKKFLSPNLTENPRWEWKDEVPKDCPHQGFFYGWDGAE